MRIWTGPPGSGKTAGVLEEFRAALREGRDDVRLLVPTATMAEHLQNAMAREGFVFRRSLAQTLNGFVESLTNDVRQVSDAVLYLIVEEAVRGGPAGVRAGRRTTGVLRSSGEDDRGVLVGGMR
jgi:hypothetical protein